MDQWNGWIMELKLIERVKIPRCYSILIPTADSIQLHVFCDASEEAFCSVAYIRVETKGRIETNFVMSKTRVSPKKITSIPRLELQAALLGTRMATLIREELETVIPTTHYWSDSKTVLYWLMSDTRQFKQFVANRVGEIEGTSDISNWHWVPTQENVADEGTRSNKTSEFEPDSRWFNGPAFLLLREEDWPKEGSSKSPEEGLTEQVFERKTDYVNVISTTVSALPDVSRFSTWTKLIRTTAQTVRYVKNCWNRRMKIPTVTRSLTVVELRYAEKLWNRQCQMESFSEEVSRFSSGKELQKSSRLNQLSPFMDEYGVLRVKGRLAMAKNVDFGLKFPVILDPCHPYTKLLIDHYHVNGGHHGTERIKNEIRQSFWILNLGSAVKIAWTRCQPCKNSRAKPVMPEMGAIPMCRLKTFTAPFTITGLDYFGPLEVTVGRRREKRWVALFMCMTTRAIHCEIAERLDTDAAINAIRRFISIRGKPQEIHSDNGTNFKGADGELRKALKELDQPKIQSTLSQKGIEWKFIPPSAPHMGGSWERLIRSVKVAMNAILKEQAPREKVLETVLKEATFIVNRRPLTHVSVDPEDPESLTPNHFLIGSSGADSRPGLFDDSDLYGRKQWRIAQRLTDHFWKRWTKEYLPTLSRRCKWHTKVTPMKIGDIVVIADYNGPRNQWPLGIIINTHPGKDEQVRVVTLRTSTGIYKRPVAKQCKLDVHRKDQAVSP